MSSPDVALGRFDPGAGVPRKAAVLLGPGGWASKRQGNANTTSQKVKLPNKKIVVLLFTFQPRLTSGRAPSRPAFARSRKKTGAPPARRQGFGAAFALSFR